MDEIREDQEVNVVLHTSLIEPTNGSWLAGIGQLSAVFGCIRDVSSVLDDVNGVGDEGSTGFDSTQVSDLSFVWFVAQVPVYEFPTASSAFGAAFGVVDGTREDQEAKREQWFTAKVWVNESLATYIGSWAVLCDFSRRRSSRVPVRTYLQTGIFSRLYVVIFFTCTFMASETTDFDYLSYSGCDHWGVHFGGRGATTCWS